MKTWKRLISGLLSLTLLASLSFAALAAEPKTEEVPKPAGQFSQWFSSLGINPKAPKASEEVLARMGTAIKQSKTVGKTTVTLNAAAWDGTNLWLSFDIKGPNITEEVRRVPINSEKSYLRLRDDQWKEYTRNMLEESYADDPEITPEQAEKEIQARLDKGQDSGMLLIPEERKGNTLSFQINEPLFESRWFTKTKQPVLTLHLEDLAFSDSPDKVFLKGPFDFTFKLEKLIPAIRYERADVKATVKDIPLRFTGFQISALALSATYEAVNPEDLPEPGPALSPEENDRRFQKAIAVCRAVGESVRGLWTKDGSYVDLTQMGSGGGSSYVLTSYPYPVDPAQVTAVDIGGTRVELAKLKPVTK